ncbi:DUF262 domain-containing protein [Shewanella baltica]|uniref:DUF262 domain-containing protein n=1 Tax=Shewanella baltica TaxID=62322 RepID=UPI003D7B21EB
MSKKITGAEYPLAKIFSSDFDYEIPPYQRPYAWTFEQVGELFDDLYDFYCHEKEDSYFLGSIVLIKSENHPHSQVIDGQQRLTTLTLMIAALTSLLSGEDREECFSYIQEPGKKLQGISAKPRLALRLRDRDFFARTVQKLDFDGLAHLDSAQLENESQKNIRANAIFLLNKLRGSFSSQEALIEFGMFLMTRCFLVVVSTPSQQSAFRVFSVLNNRGLDLLPSDIIKAEAIGKIAEGKRASFNDRWEGIEVDLGRDGLNDLLGFIRMIYAKSKSKRALLEEFKEHVLAKVATAEELIDNVIEPYANAYMDAKFANYEASENAGNINLLFNWLNRIDNSDWIPVAICYLVKHSKESKAVLRFLTKLERLAAQMHICSANINQRIDRYAKVLVEISTSDSTELASLELTSPEKEAFINAINGDVYTLTARRRNYLILRLDSFVTDGAASYNHNILTIEHVLPQTVNPGSEWAVWFPDILSRLQWEHKLANLVPLTQSRNSYASNFDFERKKSAYFCGRSGVTSFALTSQVLQEKEWTQQVLASRQERLVSICKQNWDL